MRSLTSSPAVLVVDDIPAFRSIVKDMLEDLGFNEIIEASDGYEALEKVKAQEVSLIVSDYMMAPGTGLDLLRGLNQDPKLTEIPFIMVSALNENKVVNEAMELGASSYIVKPLGFEVFRSKVLEALQIRMVE